AHMKNWMDCVHNNNVKTNAPLEAGYSHSIADIMVTAALRTGQRATFDEKTAQVIAGGKVFKY
ncbi:MAG TPA: gfo/Idh/MocA family oxidoreductase, partial [Dysgonamonadaceae bacterium]|nr:gfo/Idh/MocA family oxidoreductase [Dysgonamonadaceae bacterium]